VLAHLAASLRVIAILLQPVLTHAPKEIFAQLGLAADNMNIDSVSFFDLPENSQVVKKGTPLFPRLDTDEEIDYIKSKMSKNEKVKGRKAMADKINDAKENTLTLNKKEIRFDKFDKVELRVALIKSVSKVNGA